MCKQHFRKLLLAVLSAIMLSSNATSYDIVGSVTDATGAFATLTPIGTPIGGPIDIDPAAVAAGLAGIADILAINVNVGSFCFTTGADVSGCPLGGVPVPIASIDRAGINFDMFGNPIGGFLDVTVFSPTLIISFPVFFADGTLFVDGGAYGAVTGNYAFTAIPLPPALLLMGTALLALFGVRQRS